MKTRKVGRVLSLLLAFVLVAGIMVPASSVLAETVAPPEFDDKAAITVGSFDRLKSELDSADTNGKKKYIKLTDDIATKVPVIHDARGDSEHSYFYAEVFVVDRFQLFDGRTAGVINKWIDASSTTNPTHTATANALSAHLGLGGVATKYNKWLNESTNEWIYDVTAANKNKVKALLGWNSNDNNDKIGNSYDDTSLIIRENTNVIIDLNGNSIIGNNKSDTAYTGSPSFSMPVFEVRGELTVMDRKGGGTIEGGTGYVLDGCTIFSQDISDGSARIGGLDGVFSGEGIRVSTGWECRESNGLAGDMGYRLSVQRRSYWYSDATVAKGGGVYVGTGGTFNLVSGKITRNCAWMLGGSGDSLVFKKNKSAGAYGGGVYVASAGTFNMWGGEVSGNAARTYQKSSNSEGAYAYGGGVYLDADVSTGGAVMNFYSGKVAENAAYAETADLNRNAENKKNATATGGGIYLTYGATLNMLGTAPATGATTPEMQANFPQVTNNTCGAITRTGVEGTVTVQGAGIAVSGEANLRNAIVSANDFAEFATDIQKGYCYRNAFGEEKQADTQMVPVGWNVVHVLRDEKTGLALPGVDGSPVETDEAKHEESGIFGTARGISSSKMISNGAGVYVFSTGQLTIGARTWIYDNWDLVTNGHKCYEYARYNRARWNSETQKYEYYTSAQSGGTHKTGEKHDLLYDIYYYSASGDGYTWSDTRDDVYLGDYEVMFIGEDLFECKIGINYYKMVGNTTSYSLGKASNRVFVKTAYKSLDPEVWGTETYAPKNRDIQFFFLNDNNKTWEASSKTQAQSEGVPFEDANATRENTCPPQTSREEVNGVLLPVADYEVGRYMNYKAFWDNGDTTRPDWPTDTSNYKLGTKDAPVLRFAETKRNSYLSFDYSENKSLYAKFKLDQSNYFFGVEMNPLAEIPGFSTAYAEKNNIDYFKDMTIRVLTADYENYKPGVLDTIATGLKNNDPAYTKTSITKVAGAEAEDLYFKGWTFYTSYGYGPIDVYPGYGQVDNFASANISSDSREKTQIILNDARSLFNITRSTFTIDDAQIKNDNINAGICPSFTANWYTQEELNEARKNISNVMVQRVTLSSAPEKLYLRFIAIVGPNYTSYAEAGFVFSTDKEELVDGVKVKVGSATPTIEGGYDFSVKTKIYKRIWTINAQYPNGAWLHVGTLLGLRNPWPSDVNVRWSFTEDSVFDASKIKFDDTPVGINAGLLYTNVEIPNTDEGKNTVYYATPYYKDSKGYHYGESRAVSYQWILDKDQAAGL